MMTSTVIKKQKSDVIHHRSHMTQIQGSYCKGICKNHRAKQRGHLEPRNYRDGIVYCTTCQLFLKPEGVVRSKIGQSRCICCNFLVKTRPRTSNTKQKYIQKDNLDDDKELISFAKKQQMKAREKQNQLMREEQEKRNSEAKAERLANAKEDESNKKSTPIFEEKVTEGKTYYEFRNFIEKEINLQANYQLVMLKYLLTHKEVHKGKIAESLAHYNNKDPSDLEQVKEFLDKPVYKVLLKSGFVVIKDGTIYNPAGHKYSAAILYELNGKFDEYQRISLDELLDQKIKEWNTQHGIQEFNYEDESNLEISWRRQRELIQSSDTWEKEWLESVESRKQEVGRLEKEPAKEEIHVQQHICPKCGKTARSMPDRPALFRKELAEFFGYRGKRPQSWCRECRSNKNNNIAMEESTIPPVTNPRPSSISKGPYSRLYPGKNYKEAYLESQRKKEEEREDVPDFESIMSPLLKIVCDKKEWSMIELEQVLAEKFNLSDEAKTQLKPSSKHETTFQNRMRWARFYLKKAGLLTDPRRGYTKITELGLELDYQNYSFANRKITIKLLRQFPEFVEFQQQIQLHRINKKSLTNLSRHPAEIEAATGLKVDLFGGTLVTPPVTNTLPSKIRDRLSREASSAARWAKNLAEEKTNEYLQSTKQKKVNKIKEQLTRLRAKLKAHESKPSPVRETPKAPKLTADQKNRIRNGTEYGLPPSTIALDVLGSRHLANIEIIQEYLLSAEYLLREKPKQKSPLVKQGHRFSTLVKQGHRLKSCPICKKKVCLHLNTFESSLTQHDRLGHKLKSCPICKKKVCSRLKKGTEKYWRVLGHNLKSCPICKKKVCPRLSKGHKLKSCPICKKKVCSRLWRVADGGRKK